VEEIKMNMLAKSCFAPGLIAMITNLISSAKNVEEEGQKDWFLEYTEGMGHEIYRMQISEDDYHHTTSFKKIVDVAYTEYNAVVFALEIQSKLVSQK
jgi:hypothetical protein